MFVKRSATQVIVPLVCLVAFLTSSFNPFGAAIMLWWAGQNMLDVAIYIDDARALQLQLLGGGTGQEVEGHDWEHILQLTGLSVHDHQIAWATHIVGAIMMFAGLIWGTVLLCQKQEEDDE